jgi:hypothetical protein
MLRLPLRSSRIRTSLITDDDDPTSRTFPMMRYYRAPRARERKKTRMRRGAHSRLALQLALIKDHKAQRGRAVDLSLRGRYGRPIIKHPPTEKRRRSIATDPVNDAVAGTIYPIFLNIFVRVVNNHQRARSYLDRGLSVIFSRRQ